MAVEGIGPQIQREPQIRPSLEQAEVVEALKHGNIYDVLRAPGVNRQDIEQYLSGQWRLFQNQIVQDYEVYAGEGALPPPDFAALPPHDLQMSLAADEQRQFQQEASVLNAVPAEVETEPKPHVRFKASALEEAGEDVVAIGEKALSEWGDFFSEFTMKMIDSQMLQQLQGKTEELNREVRRIIELVMSGRADPEFVLIAAAKSNMLQNGTLFSWKGKRVMHLNDQMDKISKDLLSKDPNSMGYMKDLQVAQSETRGMSTQLQMEMMDLQKFAQNVATTLEWVSNAIRMFAQMRQQPTQAIAAR